MQPAQRRISGPGDFPPNQRGAVLEGGEAPGVKPAGKLVDGPDPGQHFHGSLHRSTRKGPDFRFLVRGPELIRLSGTRGRPALAQGPQLPLSQLRLFRRLLAGCARVKPLSALLSVLPWRARIGVTAGIAFPFGFGGAGTKPAWLRMLKTLRVAAGPGPGAGHPGSGR